MELLWYSDDNDFVDRVLEQEEMKVSQVGVWNSALGQNNIREREISSENPTKKTIRCAVCGEKQKHITVDCPQIINSCSDIAACPAKPPTSSNSGSRRGQSCKSCGAITHITVNCPNIAVGLIQGNRFIRDSIGIRSSQAVVRESRDSGSRSPKWWNIFGRMKRSSNSD